MMYDDTLMLARPDQEGGLGEEEEEVGIGLGESEDGTNSFDEEESDTV